MPHSSKQQKFLNLYKECHEPFMKYCSAMTYGKMDAEDLVQDVLLSTYKHFEKIQNPKQLLHYLIRAAHNRAISLWRKKKYQTELIDLHAQRLRSKEVSAETLLDIQSLYKTLDKLPPKQKNALILFEISGFSMKEIAEMQNSNAGAVKTLVSRGRQKLKGLLYEEENYVNTILDSLKSILF